MTVSPGKGGLATFSPPLDAAGNSVRGQLVTKYLAERLGLNLFASEPADPLAPNRTAKARPADRTTRDIAGAGRRRSGSGAGSGTLSSGSSVFWSST